MILSHNSINLFFIFVESNWINNLDTIVKGISRESALDKSSVFKRFIVMMYSFNADINLSLLPSCKNDLNTLSIFLRFSVSCNIC